MNENTSSLFEVCSVCAVMEQWMCGSVMSEFIRHFSSSRPSLETMLIYKTAHCVNQHVSLALTVSTLRDWDQSLLHAEPGLALFGPGRASGREKRLWWQHGALLRASL